MSTTCGSTNTTTGKPCAFPSADNCPHHGLPKSSDSDADEDRPASKWDARVYAAYRRMLGDTQAEVSEEVSVTPRTIRTWENHETWPTACQQARDQWMRDIEREARSALYLQLKKARDPVRAMQVLERIDPTFAPPKKQLEHSGEIDTGGETHIYLPDNRRSDLPQALLQREKALNGAGG